MTPASDFLTLTRACAHAHEGQSKVGKSGEAVAKVATDGHYRFLRFAKMAAPADPNLSESQKGGCVPGVSP
jgi:hypothetical protein